MERLLIVDDEEANRVLLDRALGRVGYSTIAAPDGEEALRILEHASDSAEEAIALVLLDWMMPGMDGIACLEVIKRDPRFADLPVIMQTARSDSDDIQHAFAMGAHHYLTKPIDRGLLLTVVRTALDERRRVDDLKTRAGLSDALLQHVVTATFAFASLEDVARLVPALAQAFPDPDRVLIGLSELMINAIEHGNLGISYDEKKALMVNGGWEPEVARRLGLPEHRDKRATIMITRDDRAVHVTIKDQGPGFDPDRFLELSASRAFDPNGRGIALSRTISFDEMHYVAPGNVVEGVVRLLSASQEASDAATPA